jgi:glycosyltransferase involved in cell wall biosynthesis
MSKKRNIVISGSNIKSGGPLTIFNFFLLEFNNRSNEFNTVVFVNNKNLFPNYLNIQFIELKWYKKFIPLKFFYEYIYYYNYSKNKNIDIWISLSDCSPIVKSKIQVAYFHNSIPTHFFSLKEIWYSPLLFFQKYYSRLFYNININKNDFIIVQQAWFREYIAKNFNFNINNIIVFPPNYFIPKSKPNLKNNNKHIFVCPTKAVFYKNNEILLKAFSQLNTGIHNKYIFYITLSGNENKYSKQLYKKYGYLENVIWTGQVSREKINKIYSESNTLLFMSTLESWGLPLTEAASLGLNIVTSNLPFAHETLANYEKAIFIDTNDLHKLKQIIQSLVFKEQINFSENHMVLKNEPFSQTFDDCINYFKA